MSMACSFVQNNTKNRALNATNLLLGIGIGIQRVSTAVANAFINVIVKTGKYISVFYRELPPSAVVRVRAALVLSSDGKHSAATRLRQSESEFEVTSQTIHFHKQTVYHVSNK